MLMTSGLNFGVRATVPHFVGIVAGFPVLFLAIGLGLGYLFLSYPMVHGVIKWLGAGYLLFLAWKTATAKAPELDPSQKPLSFMQAAIFQWVNPKAWIIAIGAIATFTTVEHYRMQLLVILMGFIFIGASCMWLWLILGASLQRLIRNQRHVQIFNMVMGLMLALSVIPMLLSDVDGTS